MSTLIGSTLYRIMESVGDKGHLLPYALYERIKVWALSMIK